MADNDTELFSFLEATHWPVLAPGTLVVYTGRLLACHGHWVVSHQVGDDVWMLSHPTIAHMSLNARRDEITEVTQ